LVRRVVLDECEVSSREGGYFSVRWFPGSTIGEQNAKDALAAVASLGGDQKISMLIDITGIAGLNREARAVFARHRAARKVALLGTSPVDRLIAGYFAALDPRLVATPYFTNRNDAEAWLHRQ
jgi:hypothetical protein